MKTRTLFIIFLAFCYFNNNAQEWTYMDYNPNQPGLEYNPLKGFTSLWNPGNNFPHSIQGHLFGLDDVMTGMNTFDWSIIDNAISNNASKGNYSYIQVNIDPANGTTHMPDFLIDQVDWEIHPDDMVPDWNNETLMQAMLNFIAAYGERYNDDLRVFLVHYGLYGMWGEWHVGEYTNYEMTSTNQHRLSDAYIEAFPDKQLLARYPNLPDNEIVGYSDGLFFGQSIGEGNPWYFHNQLKSAHADQNWKLHSIGGEIDPGLQADIWKNWPNTVGQDVTSCLDSIHPSWLISYHVLTMDSASNATQWNNAIRCQKMLGYSLFINKYRLSANEGLATIELGIQNKGIAPLYANWDVEIGVIDSNDQFKTLGSKKCNFINILPGNQDFYRAIKGSTLLEDGGYKVLVRIVNPLEEFSSKAKPVRFANTNQDADLSGWLSLGEMIISEGAFGDSPIRVEEIALTPETSTLTIGDTLRLSAVINPVGATTKSISWVSDHPAIASVDTNGFVTTGPLVGEATISAFTQDGGFEAKAILYVEPLWKDIPGKIEAEDYMNQSGVQTENCSDSGGGLNVGWIDTNDWMEYPIINDSDSIYFTASLRVSSPNNGGRITIFLDNIEIGEKEVPNTGGWQNWQSISKNLEIGKGEHYLKFLASSGGFNVNYFEFSYGHQSGTKQFVNEKIKIYPQPASKFIAIESGDWQFDKIEIIDLSGKIVYSNKTEFLSKIRIAINMNPGFYILQMRGRNSTISRRMIIK